MRFTNPSVSLMRSTGSFPLSLYLSLVCVLLLPPLFNLVHVHVLLLPPPSTVSIDLSLYLSIVFAFVFFSVRPYLSIRPVNVS